MGYHIGTPGLLYIFVLPHACFALQADYATVNNSYFLLYDQSEVCKGVAVLPNDETGRAQRRIDYYATNDCNGSVLSNDFLSPFYENEAFYSSSQECASLGDTVPVSVRGIGWINGSDVQLSPTAIYLDASTFTSVGATRQL
jgi:hypothetical protein